MRYTSRELALITVLSSLGAVMSVQVGYLGNYLKTVAILPLGTGQILAGLHLIPLTVTGFYVKKSWSVTMTSAIKGLLEAVLFSFHGLPVILMSILQGLLLDLAFMITGKSTRNVCVGCGIAAASNVAYLQFFLLLPFPGPVFGFMYVLSFLSGLLLGGYGGKKLYEMVESRVGLDGFQRI